ncbi:MAG: hypothetical protein IJ315_05125 [Firmicutes bacterium]|nr:hypothetical protein [Bacillota bacterium]
MEKKKKKKNPMVVEPIIMQHVESGEPTGPYPTLGDMSVRSSMECTGLIPATPETEEEWDNYKDLYHFEP